MTSSRALTNSQIARAAAVVVMGFLASGVLGLLRTMIFSVTFGTSASLDAFYAAQRIPEALYVLVAGGALGSSFIPVFSRFMAKGDDQGAWRLASAVMSTAGLLAAVLALVVALAAPQLVPTLLVPGAGPDVQALTISLTQVMMLTVVIFSISGLVMGILNAQQIFTLPALALSMNNLGQIFGALVLVRLIPAFGAADGGLLLPDSASGLLRGFPTDGGAPVYGLAFGAVLGALLHLLVQVPGLRRGAARQYLRFLPNVRVPGVREVLLLMGPRVLGLAVVQINFMVNVNLASRMSVGSQSAFSTAWALMFFVLGVIAQSIGTAVFPSLAALAAADDMPGYKNRLAGAIRSVLFLGFPASVGMILLAVPVISLLLEYGAWTGESTQATAWALSFLALGIAGHSLLEVLSRAFYALSDTRTPVLIGLASMIANIVLSLLLIRVIGDPNNLARSPIGGLALANSLTTLAEGVILWLLLRRRIGGINDRYVLDGAGRALLAALLMGASVALVLTLLNSLPLPLMVAAGAVTGVIVFFGLAFVLGLEEARTVPGMITRRVRR